MSNLCWFCICPWTKLSWYFCSMWDKLGRFNWFQKSFWFKKDFVACMHGLAVYEGQPFIRVSSLENSEDSCFHLGLLHSVLYFFFLYQSLSFSLCTVFDVISPNIEDVLSINLSSNVFFFGDWNVHSKDWLTYFSGTGRSSELGHNFSISNYLTQMANFLSWICGAVSFTVLYFWICLFLPILDLLYSSFPNW